MIDDVHGRYFDRRGHWKVSPGRRWGDPSSDLYESNTPYAKATHARTDREHRAFYSRGQPVFLRVYAVSGSARGHSSGALRTAGKTLQAAWYVASRGQFT